jgi:hypothetical protein
MIRLFDKYLSVDYFAFSERALNLAQEAITYSSNQLSDVHLSTSEGQEILRKINIMRAELAPYPEYTKEWIEFIARNAAIYGVGNCCEKSCYAFNYLSNQIELLNINIELFNTPFTDHFFVVIGRDIATNSHDPSSWNGNCVICDPWGERDSYFLRQVSFDALETNAYGVIDDLLYERSNKKTQLVLKQIILASANGIETSDTYYQDSLVLRSRYYKGHFEIFNVDVPMCYEEWDYPITSEELCFK